MKKNSSPLLFIFSMTVSLYGIGQAKQEFYLAKMSTPFSQTSYQPKERLKPAGVSAEPAIPLKGVSAGFSIGYNYLFKNPYEYYLSSDGQYNLHMDKRGRGNLVVSTVISFRLGKPAKQNQTENGKTLTRIVDLSSVDESKSAQIAEDYKARGNSSLPAKYYNQTTKSHWTLNIGLNLVDISSDVTFNKSIDGGIGLGYIINDFAQVALFLDVVKYRQLRNHIVENYNNKPIPKGNDVYTALDEMDNSLFTNKHFAGLSFKLVLTMNNQ